MEFTSENLIDVYQNESSIRDLDRNATEEDKELSWKRIAELFQHKTPGK